MSAQERGSIPRSVPILTEVVLLTEPGAIDIPIEPPVPPVDEVVAHELQDAAPPPPESSSAPAELPANIEDQLIERVWADLQRQVDLMLEYRLREVLAPILSRATEAVVRDSRQQLASSLRDVVARAVAQELSRHRGR